MTHCIIYLCFFLNIGLFLFFQGTKFLTNLKFLEQLGVAYSENVTVLGITMEGNPKINLMEESKSQREQDRRGTRKEEGGSERQLNDEGVDCLLRNSLQENSTIVMLRLPNNYITSLGGCIIFESLRVNSR